MLSKQAKYIELGEQMLQQILQGHYAIGSLLPTEKEICQQHQISRHTAREALRYIERLGMVERRQGAGTRVLKSKLPDQLTQFTQSVQELLEFGLQTRFQVEHCARVAPCEEALRHWAASTAQHLVHLSGIRLDLHTGKPVCFSVIQQLEADEEVGMALPDKKLVLKNMLNLLNSSNIGRVEQEFTACLLSAVLAAKLSDSANSAAMHVVRRYYSKQGALLLISQSTYPAHRFRYTNILTPSVT